MSRNQLSFVVLGVVLAGVGLFLYARSGPVPVLPADLAALDPLVRRRIEEEVGNVSRRRRSSDAWLRLGMVYEANGLFGDAARCYEQVLVASPAHAKALYRLASAEERLGDLARAAETMTRAAEADPTHAASWWRLAWWRIELGELEPAASALARAEALAPADPAVRLAQVRLRIARGLPGEAIALLEDQGLLRGEQASHAQHLLAMALRRQGDLEGAAEAQARSDGRKLSFSDAWDLEMQQQVTGHAALLLRAGRDVQVGRYAEAQRALEEVVAARAAPDAGTLNMLAVCRLELGDAAGALVLLRRVLTREPDHRDGAINLVRALLRQGTKEPGVLTEAQERLLRVVAGRPDDGGAWRALAALAEARGQPAEALVALDRAGELDPAATDVRLKAAYVALQLRRFEQALARFQDLQERTPELTEAWFGTVATLIHAERTDEARAALERLAQRPDADPRRLAQLSESLEAKR